jgi:hypothetical protein
MKAYVLVGFVVLAIVAICILSRRQREYLTIVETATLGKINNRLGELETKIVDSDKKRSQSEGDINSTLR